MKKLTFPFYIQIVLSMLVGIAIGFIAIFFGIETFIDDWVRPLGKLFIKALVLIAVPLVFVSLIKGVTELKDTSSLSRLGGRTVMLYLMTTLFAVLIGLGSAMLIKPGNIIGDELIDSIQDKYGEKRGKLKSIFQKE